MDNKTNMQQVMDIMKAKGATDEQIAQFFQDLTKTNFARFYSQAMALFTEEDMKAVEAIPTDEEAHKKIREIYQQKTGKDPEEEMKKFMDDFAQGFLAEHAKNPTA